jgi:cellulose synthase/poly-beta-1,6-N-acetylglucosamine synthase-like glycosyltransferase
LESVKNQDYKDVEIIVVSDRDEIKNDGVISLHDPRCRGPGAKRNLGAKHARGDILFFLDSDCILKKDSISKLVEIFRTREIDAVSGKPLAYENSNLLCFITGLEYEDRFEQMGEGFVDVAASTCLGIKREVFFDVKGFIDYSNDDAIGEDWDLSARLRSRKYSIYHTNEVEVFHEHNSETLWYYLKRQYGHAKYRIAHFKKYRKAADQYASWSMILSATLLLGLPATIRILRRTKNMKALILPFISMLRSMAWFSGAAAGIFSLRKLSDAG